MAKIVSGAHFRIAALGDAWISFTEGTLAWSFPIAGPAVGRGYRTVGRTA